MVRKYSVLCNVKRGGFQCKKKARRGGDHMVVVISADRHGNETFRHSLKKTVRHQESSVTGQISTAFSFKQT